MDLDAVRRSAAPSAAPRPGRGARGTPRRPRRASPEPEARPSPTPACRSISSAGVPESSTRPARIATTRSAQRLGLVELVGDQQDRRALLVQLAHRCPDVPAGGRVQALRQLVEDHQPRPVSSASTRNSRCRSPPLSDEKADRRRGAEPEPLEQLAAVPRPAGGEQGDGLGHAQPVGQPRVLQLAADQRPHPLGVPDGVEPEHTERRRRRAAAGPARTRRWSSSRRRSRRSGRPPRRHGRRGRGRRRRSVRRRTSADPARR